MNDVSTRKSGPGRQAVIDVGSNSVRLVIYDGPRRAPMPICNEKALCGLGREMTEEGDLNPESVEYALATLQRFKRVLAEHDNPPTRVIATAAVREARNGKAFVSEIDKLGFTTEIIGGAREAELAAHGVVSYEPGATGLVGDMGGGSLELVALDNGAVAENVSLSIGPLRLMQASGGKTGAASKLIGPALAEAPWLKARKFKTIYSVGGAWRAIARIHMRLRDYPLPVLHHYELTRAEALGVCDLIAKQSRQSLEEIPGIPLRRLDTLPFASLVFREVLNLTKVERVMVSAGGVREGLIYDDLSPAEKGLDPLLEGARFFAARLSPEPAFGEAVIALTADLFPDESPAETRIRVATCMLSDIGAYFHPDLRAMQAFETALRAPFYAVTHKERIIIALALHCRHDGRKPPSHADQLIALLSETEQARATRLGLAMRFAGALAPKAPAALEGARLQIDKDVVTFKAPEETEALMGELPRRRLDALAGAFDVKPSEEYFSF